MYKSTSHRNGCAIAFRWVMQWGMNGVSGVLVYLGIWVLVMKAWLNPKLLWIQGCVGNDYVSVLLCHLYSTLLDRCDSAEAQALQSTLHIKMLNDRLIITTLLLSTFLLRPLHPGVIAWLCLLFSLCGCAALMGMCTH